MTGKLDSSGTVTLRYGGLVLTTQVGILLAVIWGVVAVVRIVDKVERNDAILVEIAREVDGIKPRLSRIEAILDQPHQRVRQ